MSKDDAAHRLEEVPAVGRMPAIPMQSLSTEQREAVGTVMAGRTHIAPPYRYLVASPAVMLGLARLTTDLRTAGDLTQREREIVILATATHFGSEFVKAAHHRDALVYGISKEAADAIAEGRTPSFDDAREQEVYTLVTALHRENPVQAEKAEHAERVLGRKLVAEVIGYVGAYAMTCYVTRMVAASASEVGALPPGMSAGAGAR